MKPYGLRTHILPPTTFFGTWGNQWRRHKIYADSIDRRRTSRRTQIVTSNFTITSAISMLYVCPRFACHRLRWRPRLARFLLYFVRNQETRRFIMYLGWAARDAGGTASNGKQINRFKTRLPLIRRHPVSECYVLPIWLFLVSIILWRNVINVCRN